MKGKKFDQGKTWFWFLPWEAIDAIARVMMHGADKYEVNNWKYVKPPIRYVDALYRHLNLWCSGEKVDKDSGLPHLAHVGCNAIFIIWLELKGILKCPKQ